MVIGIFAIIIMSVTNTSIFGGVRPKTESRVVEGLYANIKDFGYSAYLRVSCDSDEDIQPFACGASILNQAILLTAAHCVSGCRQSSFISVNVGSVHKTKGIQNSASMFVQHKNYESVAHGNDIALIKLKDALMFSNNVKRIVLMKDPPHDQAAVVAGWGLVDELKRIREKLLKFTTQRIWTREDCSNVIHNIPEGIICAGEKRAKNYASFGDSGSALVVQKYIQIGLVSYKVVEASRSLVAYTNVSHFYDWIQRTAEQLLC